MSVKNFQKTAYTGAKKRYLYFLLASLIVTSVFFVASPAFAAYYNYANNISTPLGLERVSQSVYDINGGRVSTNTAAVGSLYIQTFLSHPGYQVLGSASGVSPGWVYLSHQTFTAAFSKCFWYAPYDIGPFNLTCSYRK